MISMEDGERKLSRVSRVVTQVYDGQVESQGRYGEDDGRGATTFDSTGVAVQTVQRDFGCVAWLAECGWGVWLVIAAPCPWWPTMRTLMGELT